MDKPQFVYSTYINTTPERLWQALTDPAFTSRYWGLTIDSKWMAGATMIWDQGGVTIDDPDQVVLESDPYRRLAYTWHTFTPEWAKHHGFSDEFLGQVTSEKRSKVTFDIEPHGQNVKLTVIHDGFEPESTVLASVSQGWPVVLSSLKTLLETGAPLPD
jgi:uncharacterized protein YndB with AHSA1/START domain